MYRCFDAGVDRPFRWDSVPRSCRSRRKSVRRKACETERPRADERPRRITKDYPLSDVSVARASASTDPSRAAALVPNSPSIRASWPSGRVLDSDTPTPPAGAPGGSRLQPARRQPGHAPLRPNRPCLHAYTGRGARLSVSCQWQRQCPVPSGSACASFSVSNIFKVAVS